MGYVPIKRQKRVPPFKVAKNLVCNIILPTGTAQKLDVSLPQDTMTVVY